MEVRIFRRTFFLVLLVQTCYSVTRKLNVIEISNNEDEDCQRKYGPLYFITAEGPDDSINYVWSFIHNPSVLVTLTQPSTNVTVTWPKVDKLPSGPDDHHCNPESIQFSKESIFSYGISIQKIIEFNDINDTGNMKSYNSSNFNILNPRFFKWQVQSCIKSDQNFELEMLGDSYFDPNTNIKRNGNITFLASVFGSLDRFIREPSMLHSENSTQIDLTIDKFDTNSTFSKSRFAVEILVTSDGNPNSSISVSKTDTLDDQYAPGVFKVMKLKTPFMKLPSREENVGMYLEWRPISYTSDARVVTDSIEVNHYPIEKSEDPTLDIIPTILYPYYSQIPGKNFSEIIVRKMNVSFGSKGDSFYDKDNNYASWTFLAGYSSPLDEQISSLTILIISTVVALPVVPLLLYGSLILYRRITRTDNEFQNL